jgi:hypothetical protein
MGREIRRVPANWEHPRYAREDAPRANDIGQFRPLIDEPFSEAARRWKEELASWERGERPDYCTDESKNLEYWEYAGAPPERYHYRPEWKPEDATYYQVYETVSEGTPVTPRFATKEELVEYLVTHGDYWDQKRGRGGWDRKAAENFVGLGWAPSMAIIDGKINSPRDEGMYTPNIEATDKTSN